MVVEGAEGLLVGAAMAELWKGASGGGVVETCGEEGSERVWWDGAADDMDIVLVSVRWQCTVKFMD